MTATPSGRTFSFVSEGADDVKARAQIEALGRRFVTTEIKLDAARIIQENFSHSLQPRPISLSFASRLCARYRYRSGSSGVALQLAATSFDYDSSIFQVQICSYVLRTFSQTPAY
jgi:hypothetical protein